MVVVGAPSSVERPLADRHYSEKLVRLAGLGAHFYRPTPSPSRADDAAALRASIRARLRLPEQFRLYLCPQASPS